MTALVNLGLAGTGGGGFGFVLGVAVERGWAGAVAADVTTTEGREVVAGLVCEADDAGALAETGGGGAAFAAGAGSGPSFAGALTGAGSGRDPCASAGPLSSPSTQTATATRSRAEGRRERPVSPDRRSR